MFPSLLTSFDRKPEETMGHCWPCSVRQSTDQTRLCWLLRQMHSGENKKQRLLQKKKGIINDEHTDWPSKQHPLQGNNTSALTRRHLTKLVFINHFAFHMGILMRLSCVSLGACSVEGGGNSLHECQSNSTGPLLCLTCHSLRTLTY